MPVLIGSSPSSGSTLLADLLDSAPGIVCGPESRLFCYRELFNNYDLFKKKAENKFAFSTPSFQNFRGTISFKKRVLDGYGITAEELLNYIKSTSTAEELIKRIQVHYFNFRKEEESAIWVEKYPENIFIIDSFLSVFPDSYFVEIIRDPLFVYNSLRKKGFPPKLSIITWLLAANAAYVNRTEKKLITLKYEDLMSNPFDFTAELAFKIGGKETTADLIKANYEKNAYRAKNEAREKTWTASEYGKIKNGNSVELPKTIIEEFNNFSGIRINPAYAEMFGINSVSIEEICAYHGYKAPSGRTKMKIDLKTSNHLFTKFLLDLIFGEKRLKHLIPYLNPIKIN